MFGRTGICLCLYLFVLAAHADKFICDAVQRDTRTVVLNFEDNSFTDDWKYRGQFPVDYSDNGIIDNIIWSQDSVSFTLNGIKKGRLDLTKLELELEDGGSTHLNCRR